jgi:ribosomal protein S18 acetylase RimI-like enzyme
MSSNERKRRKPIKLNSDAFPKNSAGILENKIFAKSEIHDMIRYEDLQIDKDLIYFKEISKTNLGEIVKLHREWFPVDYTNEFFLNLFSKGTNKIANHIIAIGAFYKVNEKEFIVGSILCELKNENNFYNSTRIRVKKQSCFDKIFKSYEFCYIMTIGVIDECRKFGLGTKLLNEVISDIKERRKKCMAIYLHVIEYNEIAIRFYIKNEFIECNKMRNYYYINETYFHGKVLCRLFTENVDRQIVKESMSNLDEPDPDSNFQFLGIGVVLIVFLIFLLTIYLSR